MFPKHLDRMTPFNNYCNAFYPKRKLGKVHHPHSFATPAHDYSGVGWVFTDISTTATRVEKGNIEGE